jgi:pyruvate,water dikinase
MSNDFTATCIWLAQLDPSASATVGHKAANVAYLLQNDFPVPPGFCLPTTFFDHYLRVNQLDRQIADLQTTIETADFQLLAQVSGRISQLITHAPFSDQLSQTIDPAYQTLSAQAAQPVAVRSSATDEDNPLASFAGQHHSSLHVNNHSQLTQAIQICWASLYSPTALYYRSQHHLPITNLHMAVLVQQLIPAQVSGVMFTRHPVSADSDTLVIEAIYGLGELLVQGQITPDHFEVDKATLTINQQRLNFQSQMMSWQQAKPVLVPSSQATQPKLTTDQIIQLAQLGMAVAQVYRADQDIEWALTDDQFYILQSRPITS